MTSAQVRAARQLLGWSRPKLSSLCNLPHTAVVLFERTGRLPDPALRYPKIDRLALIQTVLEAAGVVFTEGGEPGVRLQECEGMTGNQAQKARKALEWSLAGLSRLSGIPASILKRFEETGRMAPTTRLEESRERVSRIQSLLEAAGIKFV